MSQDNTPRIRIPAAIFCAFTPLVVATRFWSRYQTKSVLRSDDWTILGSMICSVLLTACSFGFGKHSAALTASDKIMALNLFYCSQILYKISLNLTKASILLLYLRAFTLGTFRIACWALMAIVVAYGVAATISTILQCDPISRAWDKSIPGTCFDIVVFWYANASYTIATDLILLVLPMRVIWSLQLRAVQKVTVFSIIRMTTLVESATGTDPTYDIESTGWANIEANVAILCACLPIFRRPLALVFPRLFAALGEHPTPARKTESHTFSHVEEGRSQRASDCSKTGGAPNDTTRPRERDSVATQTDGYVFYKSSGYVRLK